MAGWNEWVSGANMTLSEVLDALKSATIGLDVKDKLFWSYYKIVELAIKEGNANFDVAKAAGAFKDLASRLDASDQKMDNATARLSEKIGGGVKAEPEDLSASTLALVTGTGTVDLLTIPQDNSVTPYKMTSGAVTPGKLADVTEFEGGNLYWEPDSFLSNTYINTADGSIRTSSGWGVIKFRVIPGQRYSLWLPTNIFNSLYFRWENALGELISHHNWQGMVSSEFYKGNRWMRITAPANATWLYFNARVPDGYDGRFDTMIVQGDEFNDEVLANGVITKLFGRYLGSKSKYEKLKLLAVGDSLTELNSRSTKFYHEYIADDIGIEVINFGKSGTGYKRTDASGTAFYQRISSAPLDADVVTIFGSFNDLGAGVPMGTKDDTGTETLGGAINTTINNLFERLPGVPLGIISPTPWQTTNPFQGSVQGEQYITLLKDICAKRGIPFLDLYHSSGLRPWETSYRALMYSRDDGGGTHPDENGHKVFYPKIREFIKTLV